MKKNLFLIIFMFITLFSLVGCNSRQDNQINNDLLLNNIVSNGINLKMQKLSSGVMPIDDESNLINNEYIIVADVYPLTATNKNLNWDFAIQNNTLNESVNDYLNIVIADNTLSATVSLKLYFDKPIILTVSSISNPDINATIEFRCTPKITNCEFTLILNDGAKEKTIQLANYGMNLSEYISFDSVFGESEPYYIQGLGFNPTVVGTESVDYYYIEYGIRIADNLQAAINDYLAVYNVDNSCSVNCIEELLFDSKESTFEEMTIYEFLKSFFDSELPLESYYEMFSSFETWFTVEGIIYPVCLSGEYSDVYGFRYDINGCNISNIPVNEIELSQNSSLYF